MAVGPTTALRRALKERFFPHAVGRGFVLDERDQPRSTTFRRRGEKGVHVFEVRWEKYGRPRFAVHFGTCPLEGLHVSGVTHTPEETFATWCADAGTLGPRRGARAPAWFRQDAAWWERLVRRPPLRDPTHVVDELLAVFPELERYWANGDVGAHLRLWRIT